MTGGVHGRIAAGLESYNPRWLVCARALDVEPSALTAYRFIMWMNPRIAAYQAEMGGGDRIDDHDHFTRWLDEQAGGS